MARGGSRTGRPAATYANRSDLHTPDAVYGDGVNQAAVVAATPGSPSRPASGGSAAIQPGAFGPLTAPSDRPSEPVTAGLPIGPGPGPEALSAAGIPVPDPDPDLDTLRALYRRWPFEDLRRMIEHAERTR